MNLVTDSANSCECDRDDEIQECPQTIYPAMDPEHSDTFRRWDEILGSTCLKQTLAAFVETRTVRDHILAYGANHSGKTWSIHLALQAKFCRNRDDNRNPCQKCVSCNRWNSGARYRNGGYFNGIQSFEYVGVNCADPRTFEEAKILDHADCACPLIAYLDEVNEPVFGPCIPKLYKPMKEQPITIIASGVRIKSVSDRRTGKIKPGLPPDFRYRFPNIEKTTTTAKESFLPWLGQQCARRLLCVSDAAALELIWEKSRGIPGQALRPLKKAQLLKISITRAFIEQYRWDAE